MKKVLTLLFFSTLVSHAATITESNLPAVSVMEALDKLRINTRISGLSRSITLSNLIYSIWTNGVNSISNGTASFVNTNTIAGNIVTLDAVRGNDATARFGNPAFPYLTPTNAFNAMRSNSRMDIRPGIYFLPALGSPGAPGISSNGPALYLNGLTNWAIKTSPGAIFQWATNSQPLRISRCKDFEIDGLTLDNTNKSRGSVLTNLVSVIDITEGSSSGWLHHLKLRNFPNHGIIASCITGPANSTNIWVTDSEFYNGGATNGVPTLVQDGACIEPGSQWFILRNKFFWSWRGVELYRSAPEPTYSATVVSGNEFYHMCGDPIVAINGGPTDSMNDYIITDNIIRQQEYIGDSRNGIAIQNGGQSRMVIARNTIDNITDVPFTGLVGGIGVSTSTAGKFQDSIIEDNIITGCSSYGISVDDGGNLLATNNIIRGNKLSIFGGSALVLRASGTLVVGNDFNLCPSIVTYLYGGVRNYFLNNTFRNCSGTTVNYLEASFTNNWFIGNIFDAASSAMMPFQTLAPLSHNEFLANWTTNGMFFFTNATEATRIGSYTRYIGTNAGRFDVGGVLKAYGGLTVPTLSTNEAVLIGDANGVASWRLPHTLQEVRVLSNALYTVQTPAIVAVDDTTLSLAETTNVLVVTITPKRADTFIVIDALLSYGTSTGQRQFAGIFRDAATTAASVGVGNTSGAATAQIRVYSKFPSTSTSATTFSVRMGIDTGSAYMNGLTAARLFGGTMESWVIAREVSQ